MKITFNIKYVNRHLLRAPHKILYKICQKLAKESHRVDANLKTSGT
jgi:hypothetical protein